MKRKRRHLTAEFKARVAIEAGSQRIPATFNASVIEKENPLQIDYDHDGHCLGLLKHYRSLMPMAMEAPKPVFHLKSADGAIGAHTYSVKDCESDFRSLAEAILGKLYAETSDGRHLTQA